MPNTEAQVTLPSSRVYIGAPVADTLAYIVGIRFLHTGTASFAKITTTEGKIINAKVIFPSN